MADLHIKVDEHEPSELEGLIQQSVPTVRLPLNRSGFADFNWDMYDATLEQVERKQAGEAISNMAGTEDQLRRQVQHNPTGILWLIIENGIVPAAPGHIGREGKVCKKADCILILAPKKCIVYRKGQRRFSEPHLAPIRHVEMPYSTFSSWLTGIERAGIRVKRVNDWTETARVIVGMAKSAQKPGTTLQRHMKPRITFIPDPQVMTLLGAHKSGVDKVMAERLIKVFGTVGAIISASPETIAENVAGMGKVSARKLLAAYWGDKYE